MPAVRRRDRSEWGHFRRDGHGGDSNARIVKFSKDGTVVKTWGKKGMGPGEFDTPHGLALGSRGGGR